jgi:hypothetical protein
MGLFCGMKARWLLAVLVCVGTLGAAEIGIEFSGVLGTGKDVRVSLTNKANGVSEWVVVGKVFAGYKVAAYDAKNDVVVLSKDGEEHRLALKQSKVQHGAAKSPAEIERAVLNNLRQLCAAADQFYLENGKTSVTYDELVGPTKYVKAIVPQDGENYRSIVFAQGKKMSVTTSGGQTISYDP